MSILLEVIVASLDDARAASAGGADRFELCSALALGGLTPSLGTLAAIKEELSPPVMYMVRPREGGMAYTENEARVMERDAELALQAGADGIVFGFLTHQGQVDVARCRRVLKLLPPGRQSVFHRAFDVVADPERALEQLIELGFTRVLTSGRAATVTRGLDQIVRTIEQAAGRIEVLPGGGITIDNVRDVVAATGVRQVHLALMAPAPDLSAHSNPAVYFGASLPLSELEYAAVDAALVARARAAVDEESRQSPVAGRQ